MPNSENNVLAAANYLKIPDSGEPYLEGLQCNKCSAIFTDKRNHCAKCGTRDELNAFRLSQKGTLHSYSIVHRTFPGVETPFVSAIVDLQGGGTIKGNLIGVNPTPESIEFGMNVDVVFKDALGRKDKNDNAYLCFFFQPSVDK